jgi:hypothetical protein
VKADLNKQEELFQVRMMKRVKSTGKLWYYIYWVETYSFFHAVALIESPFSIYSLIMKKNKKIEVAVRMRPLIY